MIRVKLKALSLKQPWAWAIFHGKDVENRTWSTPYSGKLLIHASKTVDEAGYLFLASRGIVPPPNLPRGQFVGEVNMVDCRSVDTVVSMWAFGPYCWIFANAKEYEKPFIGRGKLGIFEVVVDNE